jgi:hypothetical protein
LGLIKWSRRSRRNRWIFGSLIAVLIVVLVFVLLSVSIAIWPGFGAWGAEVLRHVLGARATSAIEGFFLRVADSFRSLASHLGIGDAKNPFLADIDTASTDGTTPGGASATAEPLWKPAALEPMGTLQDEGVWVPYLVDTSERIVGYRTALQPDRKRGYSLAAVVAVDLEHTRLHYVLGREEPSSNSTFPRPGKIPESDLYSGRLLGAFNGGFKAENGHFGAMADGNVALPPKAGLGTIVMYTDGRVAVGEWGKDFTASPDMESWRQNGPLLVSNGQIGPEVRKGSTRTWGDVYGGGIAGWRSAVGLSTDGRTLYFVVGPSLTIGALAASTIRAGAWNAIELDINRAWTRFDKIVVANGKLTSVPIMDGLRDDDRLIREYARDFFYIISSPEETESPGAQQRLQPID